MADEKQNSWLISLDEIIKYQPEVVMSMFVSDLKTIFAAIHAASGLLSDEEVDVETHDKLIEIIEKSSIKACDGLELMLAYLKARAEIKRADAEGN